MLRLGAQQVVDYHTERFEDVAKDVDVVFDGVGGSTLQRSWDVLRPGGRLVTIVSTVQSADDERTKQALFFVEPNRPQLCDIAAIAPGAAHEDQFSLGVGGQERMAGRQGDRWAMVTAHAVNGEADLRDRQGRIHVR